LAPLWVGASSWQGDAYPFLVQAAPRLQAQWPVLASQLRTALVRLGESALAASVPELRVVAECGCGDDFCQSFYTEQPPDGAYPYPDRARNVCCPEPGWQGMLVLDVVDERIHFVEVIDRPPLD
jgi:hypothetical protein